MCYLCEERDRPKDWADEKAYELTANDPLIIGLHVDLIKRIAAALRDAAKVEPRLR